MLDTGEPRPGRIGALTTGRDSIRSYDMSRRTPRLAWPWDGYLRHAPVLRDLGIDPNAAFERLEELGKPFTEDELARFGAHRPHQVGRYDSHCRGCMLRRFNGQVVR